MVEKSKSNYIKYNKTIIIGVVILLLLFSAVFYYFYQLAYNNQLQSFIAQQQLYLKIVTGNFKRRLEMIIEKPYNIHLKNISSKGELSNSLQLHGLPEIRYMALVEKNGAVRRLNNKFGDANLEKLNSKISDLAQNNWNSIKGNYQIPALQISKEKQLMLVFYPLKISGQKKIIAFAVDLSILTQNYIAPIKLNKSGIGYLIDGQGRVVYDHAEEIIGDSVFELHQDYEKLLAVDKKMINTHSGTDSYNFIVRETGEESKKYISWQTIRLGSNQLVLAISTPEDDIVAGIKSLRNKLIILTSIIFVVLILAGYSFYKFNKQRLVNILEDLQEDYEQQTERLQTLSEMVEQSDDSIMQTDTAGNIEYVNSATEELFGWSREELNGKSPEIFNAEENSDEIQTEIFSTLAQGEIYENEILNQRKDGSTFWCQLKTVPLINSSGETYAYMGIQRNITERMEREERLKEAKEEAEVANQAKSEFLANMSHEIRTPLNAVIGFSDLLNELVESNQQQEYVTAIKTSGETLLTLINDILDLSKIESGNLEIDYDYFDLEQLIREMEQIFTNEIKQKDLKLIIDLKSELPLIKLDKTRMRQILLNLVGNAVKFTEQGYIKIVVDIKKQSKEKVTLYLSIEDTGVGIAEEKEIFKSFRQGNNQLNKEYQGTGLGLTMTYLKGSPFRFLHSLKRA
ncbi:PAS domain-containing sensor histidine kinase [Halanaerobacter jeridensis]|uniref:histidine kinase n=1 Tax=Halanaerobacter jeridensis TaxID=706427 RepID=A0A938XS22_9FIRM|nr:PAS domain S-box protein [Halanaerobacter jeridensis]MBM7555784.1 PAS domain S-box-containing protein [Halanaerobacter jeridensis]